jgi:hypothetical protein
MTFLVALVVGMEFPLAAMVGPAVTIQLNHETHQRHERKTTTSKEEPEVGASDSAISSLVTQRPPPQTKLRFLFSCVSWLHRLRGHGSANSAAASRIYTADFVGAGLGAFLASAWLIPLLGLGWTCRLVALLNLLAGALLLLRNRST